MSVVSSIQIAPEKLRLAAQLARWFTVLLLLSMFVGTHIPGHSLPGFSIGDKIIHYSAYLTLTLSILTSWELTAGVLRPPHYFAVWLATTLYGAFDEISQTPFGRSCDGLDWLADIAGIVSAIVIYQIVRGVFLRVFALATTR